MVSHVEKLLTPVSYAFIYGMKTNANVTDITYSLKFRVYHNEQKTVSKCLLKRRKKTQNKELFRRICSVVVSFAFIAWLDLSQTESHIEITFK